MRFGLLSLLLLVAAPALAQDQEEEAIPEPPPSVDLRPATVHFQANLEGLGVLYLQDPVLDDAGGTLVIRPSPPNRYVPLCETPCDRELPQTHLGLAAMRGGHLIRFSAPLGVDGPTAVRLRWHDREMTRLAGLLTAAIGGTSGLTVGLITGIAAADDTALAAGIATGSTLLIGALVVGILLALMDDDATFESAPMPSDGTGLFSQEWD